MKKVSRSKTEQVPGLVTDIVDDDVVANAFFRFNYSENAA